MTQSIDKDYEIGMAEELYDTLCNLRNKFDELAKMLDEGIEAQKRAYKSNLDVVEISVIDSYQGVVQKLPDMERKIHELIVDNSNYIFSKKRYIQK